MLSLPRVMSCHSLYVFYTRVNCPVPLAHIFVSQFLNRKDNFRFCVERLSS